MRVSHEARAIRLSNEDLFAGHTAPTVAEHSLQLVPSFDLQGLTLLGIAPPIGRVSHTLNPLVRRTHSRMRAAYDPAVMSLSRAKAAAELTTDLPEG